MDTIGNYLERFFLQISQGFYREISCKIVVEIHEFAKIFSNQNLTDRDKIFDAIFRFCLTAQKHVKYLMFSYLFDIDSVWYCNINLWKGHKVGYFHHNFGLLVEDTLNSMGNQALVS